MIATPSPDPAAVTIVMATLNGARHLPQQLTSLADQTHRNWSLFVSDDESTDDTKSILRDFGQSHPVHVVEGPRRGAAANFLSALYHPALRSGFIALADQDDVWMPEKLARGLAQIKGAGVSGPVLYAAESILTDATLRPLRTSTAGNALPGFAPSLCQNLFGGHTMMLNAEALALVRAAGPVSGIAYHDWWIYQLIAGAEGRLLLDAQPMAYYRQHQGNVLGGTGSLPSAFRRLLMTFRGTWGGHMQSHAQALAQTSGILSPQARKELSAFLAAPPAGPARIAAFRRLGLRRSSSAGTALMLLAAGAGLL